MPAPACSPPEFAAFPENLISPVTFLLASDSAALQPPDVTGGCVSWTTRLWLQHCSSDQPLGHAACSTRKIEQSLAMQCFVEHILLAVDEWISCDYKVFTQKIEENSINIWHSFLLQRINAMGGVEDFTTKFEVIETFLFLFLVVSPVSVNVNVTHGQLFHWSWNCFWLLTQFVILLFEYFALLPRANGVRQKQLIQSLFVFAGRR